MVSINSKVNCIMQAPSYLSPAERAKAAAEEAAAEEARMRVAADDSADRALKQV